MTTSETLSARCDAHIAARNLLQHPFYQAWSDGTLPVPALADYAREYGAFISRIADGWRAVGEPAIAGVEVGHAKVWGDTFAAGLSTAVDAPQVRAVQELCATADALFADRVTALGALYAFEAQQPLTARSKRAGLASHYAQLPAECETYFRLHEDDDHEPALLAAGLNDLPADDRTRAEAACAQMSVALWDALTGLYAPHAMACSAN
ncbi:MAG: iron-containing redox enzyme family protein [Anaerolineae bacterium]